MSEPLLMSKCRVPRACREPISRPRLLARFAGERGARVVVVTAPAGYGKTTLVTDWARSTSRATGWLSLDELDDDLHRFWSYFGAVLDAVLRDRGDNLRRFRTPHCAPASPADAVIHQLERISFPCEFVIDDFQCLRTEGVLASVNLLVRRLPDQCRLLVISRKQPRLALSRLRLRGELEEITARCLRFSQQEVLQLFNEVIDGELILEQANALLRATEGWPAALRLALVAYKEQGGRLEEVLSGGAARRYVYDFFAEEVFERLDEDVRRFMMLTSVLRRFCAPLCDAVTGLAESAQLLRRLERSNLFLIPLGGEMKWFRYHRLFGGFLRARLEEHGAARVEKAHRRAADWYESKGRMEEELPRGARTPDPELLSRRELEVLRLLDRGESNKGMARRLGVSVSTVKTHLSHIYEKLDAHSRTQAVCRARRLSLLDDLGLR